METNKLVHDIYGIFTKKLNTTPSSWAEKHCLIDGHPIRWSDFPHVPYILDLAADNTIEDIIWVTSIGTGKTGMIFCYLAYNIVYGIVPIQWIMPTQESFLDNVLKPRWVPFIQNCDELKGKLPQAKAGKTNFLFNFPATPLKCSWAGAKQGKRGFHCGRVVTDETADIPDIEHYRGRTITFAGNKQHLHCGNHRKESNALNKLYTQGSRHKYMVPNPNVPGELMELLFFGNMQSDDPNNWELLIDCDPEAKKNMNKDGILSTTYLKDPLTKQRWDPQLRGKLLREMKWVQTNPYSTKSLSFTQNSLTTITKNPGELLWQWLNDKDDPTARTYFLNTYLGIPEREQSVIVLQRPSMDPICQDYKRGYDNFINWARTQDKLKNIPYTIIGTGDVQGGDRNSWALVMAHFTNGFKYIIDWYNPPTLGEMDMFFDRCNCDFSAKDGRYRAKEVYESVFQRDPTNSFVIRAQDRQFKSIDCNPFEPFNDGRYLTFVKYNKEQWSKEMYSQREGRGALACYKNPEEYLVHQIFNEFQIEENGKVKVMHRAGLPHGGIGLQNKDCHLGDCLETNLVIASFLHGRGQLGTRHLVPQAPKQIKHTTTNGCLTTASLFR